jgi:hypothetical protein
MQSEILSVAKAYDLGPATTEMATILDEAIVEVQLIYINQVSKLEIRNLKGYIIDYLS